MRSSTVLAGFFVSVAFLVTGCDDLKDKLGMGDKKEAASKDEKKDKKKKSGDEEETEEEGSAKPAASGSPTTAPAAPTPTPSTPAAGPLGAPGKAGSHLPADCDAVATVNLGKILSHQAFASQVVPALDEAIKKATTDGPNGAKVDSFLKETGINPKAVSDIAVCIKNASPEPIFGVIIAGSFTAESLVPALEKANPEEFKGKVKDLDGRKVAENDGVTLGQLGDASIALAVGEAFFKSLSATSDNATSKYKLDGGKDIMISVPEGSVAKFAQGEPQLANVKGATISLDLTASKFMARIITTSPDEAKKLDAIITLAKSQAGADMAGLPPGTADILKALTTKVEGNDLLLEAPIPAQSINGLASMIAAAMKEQTSSAVADIFPADPKAAATPVKPGTTATPTKPTTKPLLRRPGGLRFPKSK